MNKKQYLKTGCFVRSIIEALGLVNLTEFICDKALSDNLITAEFYILDVEQFFKLCLSLRKGNQKVVYTITKDERLADMSDIIIGKYSNGDRAHFEYKSGFRASDYMVYKPYGFRFSEFRCFDIM